MLQNNGGEAARGSRLATYGSLLKLESGFIILLTVALSGGVHHEKLNGGGKQLLRAGGTHGAQGQHLGREGRSLREAKVEPRGSIWDGREEV